MFIKMEKKTFAEASLGEKNSDILCIRHIFFYIPILNFTFSRKFRIWITLVGIFKLLTLDQITYSVFFLWLNYSIHSFVFIKARQIQNYKSFLTWILIKV